MKRDCEEVCEPNKKEGCLALENILRETALEALRSFDCASVYSFILIKCIRVYSKLIWIPLAVTSRKGGLEEPWLRDGVDRIW